MQLNRGASSHAHVECSFCPAPRVPLPFCALLELNPSGLPPPWGEAALALFPVQSRSQAPILTNLGARVRQLLVRACALLNSALLENKLVFESCTIFLRSTSRFQTVQCFNGGRSLQRSVHSKSPRLRTTAKRSQRLQGRAPQSFPAPLLPSMGMWMREAVKAPPYFIGSVSTLSMMPYSTAWAGSR